MNNPNLQFNYKLPIGRFLLIIALAIGLSISLVYVSQIETNGIRLFHIITISPENAPRFTIALAILIGSLSLIILSSVITRVANPQRITIEADRVIAPKSSLKSVELTHIYSDISNIGSTTIRNQEFFLIVSSAGTSRLLPSAFDSDFEYSIFKDSIAQHIGNN